MMCVYVGGSKDIVFVKMKDPQLLIKEYTYVP